MSTARLHTMAVNEVAAATQSSSLLRSYRIDPTARMSLETAAAAAGTNSDELMALVDAGSRRRSAFRAPVVPAYVEPRGSVLVEEYEDEAELV
jgi:hypothetical protein